ncbi:UDP-N-acetylmuramoyl-L-alanine--D-glutamate ligase [Candidatus Kaiserbacteria bacterium]|nr:UDP-N-acetylmuramoyl-L-alanine--D-glutamate ligase [Candidatus Kaiserbacteria bacterium]
MSYADDFNNKRITVLGLGLLGRGIGDVEFLAKCGAEVLVTDKKTEAELAGSVAKLKKYANVTFKLGGHDAEDFSSGGGSAFGGKGPDMVLKAAGVPLDSKEVAAARAAGIPVAMSTALFAKYAMDAGAKIVGVTGTRGKTTVAHMIYHTLESGMPGRGKGFPEFSDRAPRPFLGGNIRGISTLAMLPDVKRGDIAVLELDSWQLQGFGDLKMSPDISIFTNLMPDHQNYYKDMDEYFRDKANIFRYQKVGGVLVVGGEIADKVRAEQSPLDPVVPEKIPSDWKLRVVGEHNRENASFANAALQALGLPDDEIKAGLESFEGVEGRLQFVREVNGVKIYNDNNATTPEATIAALRALGGNITLITGGSEKGLALEELVSEIKKRVSNVILLTHPNYQGSERLAGVLKKAGIPYDEARELTAAVTSALEKTKTGTILFSPAFASFGMFKNEYERNDQFLELVHRA